MSFTLYKNHGAMQASFIPAKKDPDRGFHVKDGGIYVEMAQGIGKQKWDWSNKVTFTLGISDITELLKTRKNTEVKLIHKYKDQTKILRLIPGEGQKYKGTWMASLTAGDDKASVPISGEELEIFMRLCFSALPHIVGWFD